MNQFDCSIDSSSVVPTNDQDQNTTFQYSLEGHPSLNFSSHLFDDELFLSTIMLPYETPTVPTPSPLNPPPTPPVPPLQQTMEEKDEPPLRNPVDKGKQKTASVGGSKAPKRKSGKKDRHSKIHTAQGPRDRRMRLSLQIARKFFDLQDLLGFDKASKTIEWLFNKSKTAIKDLTEKSCSISLDHASSYEDNNGVFDEFGGNKQIMESKGVILRNKESRARARERARERTKEKLMMRKERKNNMEQNPSSGRARVTDHRPVTPTHRQLEDQLASIGIIERLQTSSSSISNLHDGRDQDLRHALTRIQSSEEQLMMFCNDAGFEGLPGNWETRNARINLG